MNLPELGSVALGITDIRKEMVENHEEDIPIEIIHTYDFNCSCKKCISGGDGNDRVLSKNKSLKKIFKFKNLFFLSINI
jgi:hypothetical protein